MGATQRAYDRITPSAGRTTVWGNTGHQFSSGMTLGTDMWVVLTRTRHDAPRTIVVTPPIHVANNEKPCERFGERIRRDLERLKDGWGGSGTIAPSTAALAEAELLLDALPTQTREPEVEVDEETGHITLRWTPSGVATSLAFLMRGSGAILAVKTSVGGAPVASSKSFTTDTASEHIARYLASDDAILDALTHA